MTHEEMGARLRVLADCRTLTVENRAELDRIANELAPARPEPGTVVWFRVKGELAWWPGKTLARGVETRTDVKLWGEIEWKPAYVAPPDGDSGTEALIDELRNRIAEVEAKQLKPDEVAVKVPPVRDWPRGTFGIDVVYDRVTGPDLCLRLITRAEAEAREASDD